MTDLWPEIEQLLVHIERPSRYLNHEFGSVHNASSEFNFCMIYPDTYELGQSNQAVRILVNKVNEVLGMSAQRSYLPTPDMIAAMRERAIPLFSIETCSPVREFDVVGITLPHELAATNVLELLDLAGIPLYSKDRKEDDPIVLGGGPCAFNPEPYAPFFDAISIGEGEEATPQLCSLVRSLRKKKQSRSDILYSLATQVSGTYVPSLYGCHTFEVAQEKGTWVYPLRDGVPSTVKKRIYTGFSKSDAWEANIVPFAETVHDRLNVEILRGCARGCRFCQAGMMYRPVRERNARNIVASVVQGLACTGYNEVSLTSLSSTDHSQIQEILTTLNKEFEDSAVRVSLPSQRMDSFGVKMAHAVSGNKKGGLTFAPEAGSQRLRDVINKNVTEENIFSAASAAASAGWLRCKLYFMVGLPRETDDDLRAIAHLSEKVLDCMKEHAPENKRSAMSVTISCALFVPKAQTPFQWEGQISIKEATRRVAIVRESIKHRAIRMTWHDPKTSFLEALMSRGGRELSSLIEQAWKNGARFDAWTELFNMSAWEKAAEQLELDLESIAQSTYSTSHVFPFHHISCGVSDEFFIREYQKALQGKTTPDCTFSTCCACGVCQDLSCSNNIAGERGE